MPNIIIVIQYVKTIKLYITLLGRAFYLQKSCVKNKKTMFNEKNLKIFL